MIDNGKLISKSQLNQYKQEHLDECYLNSKQAAEYINVTIDTLRDYVIKKKIFVDIKIDNFSFFSKEQLDKYKKQYQINSEVINNALTRNQAAEYLNVTTCMLDKWKKLGILVPKQISKRNYYSQDMLDKFKQIYHCRKFNKGS